MELRPPTTQVFAHGRGEPALRGVDDQVRFGEPQPRQDAAPVAGEQVQVPTQRVRDRVRRHVPHPGEQAEHGPGEGGVHDEDDRDHEED